MAFSTDVYGLGATLFTLLTGRPPFTGPGAIVVLRKVIDDEPVWPRERDKAVGAELKAICLKCLEKNPDKRFRSAGELAAVLKKFLNYEPTGVTLPRPWARLAKWAKRQPWRAAAFSIALVGVIVAAATGGLAWRRPPPRGCQRTDPRNRDCQLSSASRHDQAHGERSRLDQPATPSAIENKRGRSRAAGSRLARDLALRARPRQRARRPTLEFNVRRASGDSRGPATALAADGRRQRCWQRFKAKGTILPNKLGRPPP